MRDDGADLGQLWDDVQGKVHHTATVIKVIDFLWSNWWWILIILAVLILWPRGRRSS